MTADNILLEPHGAVGWSGLEHYSWRPAAGPSRPLVCLETAHPAKFPEEIIELLGITPEVPPSMKDLDKRTGEPVELPADYSRLRSFLLDTLRRDDQADMTKTRRHRAASVQGWKKFGGCVTKL